MERYYFYVDYSNVQKGPFSLSQLIEEGITPSTMVWYESLPNWQEASTIEELNNYFSSQKENQTTPPPIPDRAYSLHNNKSETKEKQESIKRPKRWLIESILMIIFCCLPAGLGALLFSIKGDDLWDENNYEGAKKAYRTAGLWVKIGLIVSIILYPLFIILSISLSTFATFPLMFQDFQ